MRGGSERTGELFSYADLEDRVRRYHPLRAIRLIVNEALVSLEEEFAALYSPTGGGGRNPGADCHGEKRTNETHGSTTNPEARLYRKGKGKGTKLCFMGHGLMEKRHGQLVDACLTEANGHADRIAALHMIEPRADRPRAITLGADKAYDTKDFINELRSMRVTAHVTQHTSGRGSAIDGRTTRHAGYGVSLRIRNQIEEEFSWIKSVARQDKTKFRGPIASDGPSLSRRRPMTWCGCRN